MEKAKQRSISVFIASPGDLVSERKVFKDTINTLNAGYGDGAGVTFMRLGWEDLPAQTGRRTQAVINQQIESCDLFVLALHRRWGQKAPDSRFSSYTEEEFHLAFKLWKKRKRPEIVVFFKTVDSPSLADPGAELKKVLAFRKKLENSHVVLMRPFESEGNFGTEMDRHLRAFAAGRWQTLDTYAPEVHFPRAHVAALAKAEHADQRRIERQRKKQRSRGAGGASAKRKAAKADLSLVEIHQTELALARAAVQAASDGRIQDARVLFAKATESTTDPSILSVAAEFFRQIHDLNNSSRLAQRHAAIAQDRRIAAEHYLALVPQNHTSAISEQVLAHLIAQLRVPSEVEAELRSIYEEAFSPDKLRRITLEVLIKYFTETEIIELARFTASAVGQSTLQKNQLMTAEMLAWSQRESERVLMKRYPELAAMMSEAQDANALAQPEPISLPQLPAVLASNAPNADSAVLTPTGNRLAGSNKSRGRTLIS